MNTEALARIAELLAIEAKIRGAPPATQQEVRQTRARPLLQELRALLETTLATEPVQSDTARAINYALNQWQALTTLPSIAASMCTVGSVVDRSNNGSIYPIDFVHAEHRHIERHTVGGGPGELRMCALEQRYQHTIDRAGSRHTQHPLKFRFV